MAGFFANFLSSTKFWYLDLALYLGYAGWIGFKLQRMEDSLGSTPERLMRTAALAIAAHLIAFWVAFLFRRKLPRESYWIAAAVFGATIFALARLGQNLLTSTANSSSIELLRSNFGGLAIGVVVQTVFVAVPLLVLISVSRSALFFLDRIKLR